MHNGLVSFGIATRPDNTSLRATVNPQSSILLLEHGLGWKSSRAVVPGPKLNACSAPTLGKGTHALESPFPYGLGVHKVFKNGNSRAVSLFYVPEPAAKARGRGVLPGWYLPAKSGQAFELRVTMVQEYGPKALGRELGSDEGIAIELYVDGSRVNTYSGYNTHSIGTEFRVLGFDEACHTKKDEQEGSSVIRPFVFRKRETIPDSGEVKQDDSGSIQLKFYTGPLRNADWEKISWNAPTSGAPSINQVSEKESVKYGKSINVDRDASPVTTKYFRARKYVQRLSFAYEAIVNVFIREKFWLHSRNIINDSGNVWVPRIAGPIVDLTRDLKRRRIDEVATPNSAIVADSIDLEAE